MSFDNLNIGKKVDNFETSEVFDAYGRVDVVMGEDDEGEVITVSYPDLDDDDVSGRILTVDMPMCTDSTLALTAATRIYTSLNSKDPTAFQYVPHQTDGALADPSIEFGDSTDTNGVHVGFHTRSVSFGRLMKHDLTSPTEEEVDHEYPYQDSQQRQITRNVKDYKARLSVTNAAITAEVSRATEAEKRLSSTLTITAAAIRSEVAAADAALNISLTSKINQTASSINAEVAKKVNATNGTATTTSFAWSLTSSGHYWYANKSSTPVMSVTSSGLTVRGNITALSGYIGNGTNGFTIGSKNFYNGKSSLSAAAAGVYIGVDGISLGYDSTNKITPFSVTKAGVLTAKSGTIGGWTIGAKSLYNSLSSLSATAAGIYLGIDGIRVYKDAKNSFTLTASTGRMALLSGMTSRDDTTNTTGMYIGYDGIALGGGKFKVTNAGAVTAKNLSITGGSITLGTAGSTSYGRFTVNSSGQLTIRDDSGNATFSVSSTGQITGKNMILSGTLIVGGYSITAESLRQGAERANSGYQTWNSTTSTVDNGCSGWNSAYDSTSYGGYCYGGATKGTTAYNRSSNAWIGNYYLNFGSGIVILGSEFKDSTGSSCSGYASRSNVVTASYGGGYD